MSVRWLMAVGCLALGGCVTQGQFDRVSRAKETQAVELKELRGQLNDREEELSRQAAEELELRKRIAQLNEQLAALREDNRHLKDRLTAAERTTRGAEQRLETAQGDHRREIAQASESAARALAKRDAEISRLKERVLQLEELLARSRARKETTSTGPAG